MCSYGNLNVAADVRITEKISLRTEVYHCDNLITSKQNVILTHGKIDHNTDNFVSNITLPVRFECLNRFDKNKEARL